MILLRFDRHHVRMLRNQSGDIIPSGLADELLPLSENLFANSSSLAVYPSQLEQLLSLARVLSKPVELLKIVSTCPFCCEYKGSTYSLNEERSLYWQARFEEHHLIHTATVRFGLNHPNRELWNQFCAELSLKIDVCPLAISGCEVFLPFELTKIPYFFVEEPQNPLISRPFRSLTMFFDKTIPFAQQEADRILALSIKRRWSVSSPKPDILFISGHGESGQLQNEVLAEKMALYQPLFTVINACSLQPSSLPKGAVVYSCYDTEADRSIFAPLMKFLCSSSPQSLLRAFFIASIFYPNISHYYRLKLPFSV
ncbi:MAG: hypothetical protein ACRCY4_05390 [Brevinema sp.]